MEHGTWSGAPTPPAAQQASQGPLKGLPITVINARHHNPLGRSKSEAGGILDVSKQR